MYGLDQDDRFVEISEWGRLDFNSLREFGDPDNATTCSANTTFVGRIRQLFLSIRGLLDQLGSFRLSGVAVVSHWVIWLMVT